MRRVAVASAVLAALALAGCGGGGSGPERALTFDEVVGVVGPPPDSPPGASYSGYDQATSLTLADLEQRAQTAADRKTARTLRQAGLRRIYQRNFNGAINVADATVYILRDTAGATQAFAVLQKSLARPGTGEQLTELSVGGLGDDAWAVHLTGETEGALYLWRRSNVVVATDMSCDLSCGLDIVGAVRAYAEDIDARAKETLKR